MVKNNSFDYVVIGGGIVGVSTAWQLQQKFPEQKVLLIDKESQLAKHQTGHNSGVIHAGVYYAPGSLKADFCRRGVDATIELCEKHGVPYENCGKLIVATSKLEYDRMLSLYDRCHTNGLDVELLDQDALKLREPNIVGLGAIYVSTTSIVNYQQVTEVVVKEFAISGGELRLNTQLKTIDETGEGVSLHCVDSKTQRALEFEADYVVACTGLMADRVAGLFGIDVDFQIVPYRGEYYRLSAKHNQVVNHLIYPVPDPELPFLGVHLTRMIDGTVTVGPNAVQGFKREGYGRWNVNFQDIWEMVTFPGFWKVSAKHWRTGLVELKNSKFRSGYLKLVNKYCPSIELEDLEPYPAGIRAQAVLKDGTLVHDFLFKQTARSLHVCNAPSPAATSAIPIGEYICQQVEQARSVS